MLNSKKWIEKLKTQLLNDMPLIVFVVLIQTIIVSVNPGLSGNLFFSKIFFITALLKTFCIGVLTSLLTFNKNWLKWLFVIFNVLLFEVYLYLLMQFSVKLNPFVVSLVMQTTPQEAGEFFISFFPVTTILVLLFTGTFLIVSYFIAKRLWEKKKRYASPYFLRAILPLFVLSLLTNAFYKDPLKPESTQSPDNASEKVFNLVTTFQDTQLPYMEIATSIKATMNNGNSEAVEKISKSNSEAKIDSCHFESPNIIFVIGESFIKSHSSLYGYQHDTNPRLKEEQKKGNLFVFNDVITHRASTEKAMQMFYSTKSVDDNKEWEEQPLFPAIFKKAGYHVSLFDNQSTRHSGLPAYDYSSSYFINPSITHNQCFDYRNEKIQKYDLLMIENERNRIMGNKSMQTLVIFHLYGQHVDAKSRYPDTEDFSFFTADSIQRKDLDYGQRERIAHYDNATRYNDFVVSEILNIYRNTDAIVVYVSDHGDCMYDDTALTYGRVISSNKMKDLYYKVLYEVPMMIWCSDIYKKNHLDMVKRIQKSVDRPFMHDDICHVLFDLAGIFTSHYIPSRSVINNNFKARQRIVNDGQYNYDANKPRLDKLKLRTSDN